MVRLMGFLNDRFSTDDSNGNGTEPRRSGRRRRVNNVAYEPDSFKEAELLQQALRASSMTFV